MVLEVILAVGALLLAIGGVIGCIVPIIPGPVLSYAALLCTYGCDNSQIPTTALWMWAVATVAVSVVDYLLPGYLTRLFGGSRASVIGATAGVFAGFILFPPLGLIVCPFLGALIGELLHDSSNPGRALLAGVGSFFAFVAGTGIKLTVSICLLVLVAKELVPVITGWFA